MMSTDESNGDDSKAAPGMRAEQTGSHPQLAIDSEENGEFLTVSGRCGCGLRAAKQFTNFSNAETRNFHRTRHPYGGYEREVHNVPCSLRSRIIADDQQQADFHLGDIR